MNYVSVREDLFRGLLTFYIREKAEGNHLPHPKPLPKPLRGYYEDYLSELEEMMDTTTTRGESLILSTPFNASNPETNTELSTHTATRALQAFLLITPLITSAYYHGRNQALEMISKENYSHVVENAAIGFLRQYNFDLISNLNNDLRENIRAVLWRGIHNGDDPAEIAKRIRDLPLNPLEVMNKKTGEVERIIPAEVRADMIARTEIMRAYNQGILTTCQQYGIELFNVILGDTPCGDCEELPLNNPYRVDDLPPIPMHPNCQCTLEPVDEAGEYNDINTFYNLVDGENTPITPFGGV